MKAKKKNGKKAMKTLGIILAIIVVITIATIIANKVYVNNTIEYIKTLPSVENTDRLQVEKDADGYYTIISDRDIKVVQLTDVHIGGGWMGKAKDLRLSMPLLQ